MFFKKSCLIYILLISINAFAATISIEVPVHFSKTKDSVINASVKLSHNLQRENNILYRDGEYFINNFLVNETGIYSIKITIGLSSGEILSDSANGYILSGNDVRKVCAIVDPNCFNTTMIVYWISESEIGIPELYVLAVDTSIMKRISINHIDSIADDFYKGGLDWYRSMPVNFGILDSNYIPLISYTNGKFRNPVTTSQTLFGFYERYKESHDSIDKLGFMNNAEWLANNNHFGYYVYEFEFKHESDIIMKKNWVSAMAQGEALGALSLAFFVLKDSLYLVEADSVFKTLYRNSSDFWCVLLDKKGYYWLEEYPNKDICHVLNGKMAALWGIFQYYTITRNKLALRLLEGGLKTVLDNYKIWNTPNQDNSYYCLHREIKPSYHTVHKSQFLAFANRFKINEFFYAYFCFSNSEVSVEPGDIFFSYKEDSASVNVNSELKWHVEEETDWLSTRIDNNKIILMVDSNLTHQVRNAIIDLKIENGYIEKIKITQESKFYFTIDQNEVALEPKADTLMFSFKTNAPNIVCKNGSEWLQASIINDSLRLIVKENRSFEPRSVVLYLFDENILLKDLKVIQKTTLPFIDLEYISVWLNSIEDTAFLSVNSNIPDIDIICFEDWISYNWKNNHTLSIYANNAESYKRNGFLYLSTAYFTKAVDIYQNYITQIINEENHNFTVYPNPAHEIIRVNSKINSNTYKYELKDLFGSTKLTGYFAENTSINISELTKGVYFLVITDSLYEKYTYKIVVY
jgi:hypothetical protein